jgi:hypothetical protein
MFDLHLALHGLAIRRVSDAAGVAELVGLSPDVVQRHIDQAVQMGRVVATPAGYALTAPAQLALRAEYSRFYGELRRDAAMTEAYRQFEAINAELKRLITDWQTVEVGGSRMANNHTDEDYDLGIIERLGALHDRFEPVLAQMAQPVPRLARYGDRLATALQRTEDGEIAWISDVQRPSYHTVWFELHEDLLRILGRSRDD